MFEFTTIRIIGHNEGEAYRLLTGIDCLTFFWGSVSQVLGLYTNRAVYIQHCVTHTDSSFEMIDGLGGITCT